MIRQITHQKSKMSTWNGKLLTKHWNRVNNTENHWNATIANSVRFMRHFETKMTPLKPPPYASQLPQIQHQNATIAIPVRFMRHFETKISHPHPPHNKCGTMSWISARPFYYRDVFDASATKRSELLSHAIVRDVVLYIVRGIIYIKIIYLR